MYKILFGVVSLLFSSVCISAEYRPSRDLISLHYDFAPDPDDGHASAAARTLMAKFEVDFLVVTGTVGTNSNQYISSAGAFQDAIWGVGNHLKAYENWEVSVDTTARYWGGIIEQGGFVFVAEGGQSDFTADVIRKIREYGYRRFTNESVTVVQHSVWNENNTTRADLNYVKSNTRYIKIDDGNGVNRTADLNQFSNEFTSWARAGAFSQIWERAFQFLDPVNRKLDFSDTVELLHILGIGKDEVSDPATFARYIEGTELFVEQGVAPAVTEDAIVVEAESFTEAGTGWTLSTGRSGTSGGKYLKLLPDTRVTHDDPLIQGVNFWGNPGAGPELSYQVNVPVAGKYLVSVRAFSTGSEDNSIHVGINGEWPSTGARMQWCAGKGQWTWSSAQRTNSDHCGNQGSIKIDVLTPGVNTINFSAREDGFEFDSFRLDLIQENGSTLTDEQIAEMSSPEFRQQLFIDAQSRVDSIEAAYGECGHLSGESLTRCSDSVVASLSGGGETVVTTTGLGSSFVCEATGNSLRSARRQFANDCPMPVLDCDPEGDGSWRCSSIQIGTASPDYNRDANRAWYEANGGAYTGGNIDDSPSEPVVENGVETGGSIAVVDNGVETGGSIAVVDNPIVSGSRTNWSDSYSVDGQCFCDSTYDHGIGTVSLDTPGGTKTIREICGAITSKYGQGGRDRVYFNTIQCGHGPTNGFDDEARCPGYPSNDLNYSGPNCQARGATFNLDRLFEEEEIGEQPVDLVRNGSWWQPRGTDNLTWYMQLQGNLNLDKDADVYFIDGDVDSNIVSALKARGKRVMCYISAGSSENWRADFSSIPESVKGNDYSGWPGERWLDIRNIAVVGPIMEARLDMCKAKGFDGIDADNVNGHVNNTGFGLTRSDATTFVRWLANESHKRGMAYSLKNAEDLASAVVDDVDMIQSESCFVYNNCGAAEVIRAANKPVWMVEYDSVTRDWGAACESAKEKGFFAIYRDVLLTGSGVYRQCL